MSVKVLALSAACLVLLGNVPVHAQAMSPTKAPIQAADFIVAVVNSEPITNHEVTTEVRRIEQQLRQQRRATPDTAELARQVLDRMINEKIQLQLAKESGIRVDEPSIDQAEQMVAMQNQMDLAELHRRLAKDGIDPKKFREQLRDQLMLTRLREREVEPRVRISDLEVEQHLQSLEGDKQGARQQINIAQLLVAVPDEASAQQVATLQAKAERALERARGGEDFATLVRELSDAPDRANGGQLGLRTTDRYPQLFLDAVNGLRVGDISGLVRSGAGFHILKVVEKRAGGLQPVVVTQSRARHILLIPNAQLSEAAARDRLNDFRRRIRAGQSDFPTLAREYSQDGSAAHGGDLGWASPGQFVPEFEAAINRLEPGQVSEPLISRFGVHLIELLERRNTTLAPREQHEMVRNMLREKKLDEAYTTWTRDVRARAYVEMREPPQ
jgi:peptidyl-prolyl cis-trans isomerase SurA